MTLSRLAFGLLLCCLGILAPSDAGAQGACQDVCGSIGPGQQTASCSAQCTVCDVPSPDGYCGGTVTHTTCQGFWGCCPAWSLVSAQNTARRSDNYGVFCESVDIVRRTYQQTGSCSSPNVTLCTEENHGYGYPANVCCSMFGCFGFPVQC
jgi:hypothetical protein